MADVKGAMASAGYIASPDIAGAVEVAKALPADSTKEERAATIDRALRLKGSARVVDETMAHPAWRYVALAIVRGLLEEGGNSTPQAAQNGPRRRKKTQKGS